MGIENKKASVRELASLLDGYELSEDMFDPAEFKKGMEVEREHSKHAEIRRAIVLSHLNETPDYYSKLEKAGIK